MNQSQKKNSQERPSTMVTVLCALVVIAVQALVMMPNT